MKKASRLLAVFISFVLIIFTGCMNNGYSTEEITIVQEKFASFNNSNNFVLTHSDTIWLAEKTIVTDELSYNGTKIDRLFGCADEYFYVSTKIKNSWRNYTIHLLQVDYDTLEMQEIGYVENLKEKSTTACRYMNGKLLFSDADKYCVYDIQSKTQDWFEYNHEDFWREDTGKYSFQIGDKFTDDFVIVIDNLTAEQKRISLKNMGGFEEGIYIQEVNTKLKHVSCYFETAVERDDICYFLMQIPFDTVVMKSQAVILAYHFESEKLSYYSSIPYDIYGNTTLVIINR